MRLFNSRTKRYNIDQYQKGKKITSATLSRFYDLKLISKKASYICKQCKENVSKNNLSSNQCLQVSDLNNVIYSDVVSETLGDVYPHTIKEKIDEDVNVLFKEKFCSSAENLRTYDPVKWMNERPKELVSFLLDICNMNENDDQTAIWINKCIEQIYSVRRKRLVLPLAFKQNLLTYSLSNSKLLLNFNGRTGAGGSYTYLKNWLCDQAGEQLTVSEGVVRIVFDNEQVIGKTYSVKVNMRNVPTSVITSHAYLKIDTCDIQTKSPLKPEHWLFKPISDDHLAHFLKYPSEHNDFFRDSRDTFISKRINVLLSEQKFENANYIDDIDDYLKERNVAASQKTRVDYGAANDKTYRGCRNCSGKLKTPVVQINVSNEDKNSDPYSHFKFEINRNNTKVQVGEPDFVNPNSFENIVTIIYNIGRRADIAKYNTQGKRQWLFLENDGGIIFILLKLIFNVIKCQRCSEVMYGKNKSGLLHFEMNAAKIGVTFWYECFRFSDHEKTLSKLTFSLKVF